MSTHTTHSYVQHPPVTPLTQTIRTRTACRLLAINRSSYNEICTMFPISARTVLENLLNQAEILAQSEFRGLRGAEVFSEVVAKDPGALSFQWASVEALTQAQKLTDSSNETPGGVDLPPMTTRQEQVMSNWFRVRAMVQGFVDKHDEDRILMFLTAASHGNTTLLQKVCVVFVGGGVRVCFVWGGVYWEVCVGWECLVCIFHVECIGLMQFVLSMYSSCVM